MGIAVKFGVYVLECLFALGLIGSAITVILASIEDSEVFFSRDRAVGEDELSQG